MCIRDRNYIIARIEQLCKKKGISRYRLAQESGIAQSSISTLLNRKSVPTIQTLEKICEGLDITLAQFFAGDEEFPDLTADQKQLLSDWNAMDDHQKELVKAYIPVSYTHLDVYKRQNKYSSHGKYHDKSEKHCQQSFHFALHNLSPLSFLICL